MAGIDNLRPFPKGHKFGKGRPRGPSATTIMRKLMEQNLSIKNKNVKAAFDSASDLGFKIKAKKFTAQEALALRMLIKAINGDHKAAREILDRVEGKPVQRVETMDVSHEDWLDRVKGELEDGEYNDEG